MDLVIFAHPDNKSSHNAEVLRYVTEKLKGKKSEFEVIDLYAEKFDPVLRPSDMQKPGPEVERYQKLISRAKRIILVYPTWWFNMPAILKGFLDKTLTAGFAYNFKNDPVKGPYIEQLLKGKKGIVINTYGGPQMMLEMHGNAPEFVMDKAALEFCGVEVVARINWFEVRGPVEIPKDITHKLDKVI